MVKEEVSKLDRLSQKLSCKCNEGRCFSTRRVKLDGFCGPPKRLLLSAAQANHVA
jgi:hypothetical protein